MSLSVQTVLMLALQCQPSTPHPEELARVLTGIALQESKLDPAALHRNSDGSFDRGIMQINDQHIGRPIGYRGHAITAQSLLDPCESLAAGGAILLSGLSAYNTGSPTRGIGNGYAARAVAAISQVMDKPTPAPARTQAGTLASQMISFTRKPH